LFHLRFKPDPLDRGKNTSAIQLRGDVEIKTELMVLRADEADYHEDTGEIEARGNVRVKLGYQHGWTQ
jgi:lipopolysaccharide assembly outer membrane protein LptD (OstA)